MAKIITRILGGIGNQLFCYAAARRLALVNNAELVIDDLSGFVSDHEYRRSYQLHHFNIPCRIADSAERLEPYSKHRRYIKRQLNRLLPFEKRGYIVQEGIDFDPRILQIKPRGTVYLDGYWQSEDYFRDVAQTIRADLTIKPPEDEINLEMASRFHDLRQTVAVHVRWFDDPSETAVHNVSASYYLRAIEFMESKLNSPRYFLFSDEPEAASKKLELPKGRVTYVSHNKGDESAYADLWLMSQCRHFITANSSFSWWGAWLGESGDSVVITPHVVQKPIEKTNWGFDGLIPARWQVI